MRLRRFAGRTLLAAAAIGLLWSASTAPRIDPKLYLEDVKYLASPELKGRGTGAPELDQAARFIAGQFESFGLRPLGGNGFFQPFQVSVNVHLGPANRLAYGTNGDRRSLKPEEDFIPFNLSSTGETGGALVFAGYGITAPEYRYDDYAGLDAKDKIVLLLRHEPQEFDEKSVFNGRNFTEHAQFSSKASNAGMHGAKGVILVGDAPNHPGEEDQLEKFGRTMGPANAGLMFVQVKWSVAEQWIAGAGQDLKAAMAAIDKDLKPQSFPLPAGFEVRADVDVQRDVKTVNNVVGYLAGQSDEYVIVGAHYDHLGLGELFSMAPSLAGTVHPGADDNASGTSGVLELARYYSSRPKPRRGILFLTFSGEELGLLGSSYYVRNPVLPLEKAVAMLNMDMIGRIRDGKVYVGSAGTGSTFKPMIEKVVPASGLKVDFSDLTGYGASDHASFTARQVPVLFFFSGLHSDYHRPSDTADKIDSEAAARLLGMVSELVDGLIESKERPQFVRVAPPTPQGVGGGPGYGAYFGSVPDFGEVPKGVRFSDVREGSPAANAGLQGGDVLIEFDGKPIQNLYDFNYVLRAKKPGEQVKVKVLRNGTPLEVLVVLGSRK